MKRWQRLVEIACLFTLHLALGCKEDNECENGSCIDNECSCVSMYTGERCEIRWDEIHGKSWTILFYCYTISTALVYFSILMFTSYQLLRIFRSKRIYAFKNVVTQALLLTGLGALFRVVYYGIDPHQIRRWNPTAWDNILFDLTVICLLPCGFLIMLYWVELQRISGIQELQSITKTKKMLIAFVVFIAVIVLPLGILKGLTRKYMVLELYNGFLGITLIFLIVFSIVSGVRLMKILRGIYHTSKSPQTSKTFKVFLRKMNFFVIGTSLCLALLVVTLVVFTFFITYPYVYLVLHWVMRTEEVGAVCFMLAFLSKKKPKEIKSRSSTTLPKTNSFSGSQEELELRVTGNDDSR